MHHLNVLVSQALGLYPFECHHFVRSIVNGPKLSLRGVTPEYLISYHEDQIFESSLDYESTHPHNRKTSLSSRLGSLFIGRPKPIARVPVCVCVWGSVSLPCVAFTIYFECR